jgi:uncharacterized membrane protein
MSKKIKILILGSLLLNVFLVGLVIGNVSQGFRRERFIGRHAPELASKLSQDKAALFFETVEKVHLDNKKVHNEIREARKKAMKVLTAPEFDEATYQMELEKVHKLRGLIMQRLADATIELAGQFDRKERRALAQHLRRPPRPRWSERPPRGGTPPHHEVP